jgi:hypothetical protein
MFLYWRRKYVAENCNGFIFLCVLWRRSQWPRGLTRRSAAARLLRPRVRILPRTWMSVVIVVCCQVERPLRRADLSSRGVLPTVMRRCVWARNLVNEEAMARWGLSRQQKKMYYNRLLGDGDEHHTVYKGIPWGRVIEIGSQWLASNHWSHVLIPEQSMCDRGGNGVYFSPHNLVLNCAHIYSFTTDAIIWKSDSIVQ